MAFELATRNVQEDSPSEVGGAGETDGGNIARRETTFWELHWVRRHTRFENPQRPAAKGISNFAMPGVAACDPPVQYELLSDLDPGNSIADYGR